MSRVSSVEGVKSQLIAQVAESEADFCVSQSFKVSIEEVGMCRTKVGT